MSVGFGFSAGDFIAALNLIGDVVEALNDSKGAVPEYRELIRELYTLEDALLRVKRLQLEDEQRPELVALRQAAGQCHQAIDSFWKQSVREYEPHLNENRHKPGALSRVKSGLAKARWAIGKKDDIAKFKASLTSHAASINMLLLTVQIDSTTIRERRREEQQGALTSRLRDYSSAFMGKLADFSKQLQSSMSLGKEILEVASSTLRTNMRVFQMVYKLEQMFSAVPPQLERQQPVYLTDAFGRQSPFHLEFVRSAEALLAVLRINAQKAGAGPQKIDRGEFLIEDAVSKREIDLRQDWDSCFHPGQRVNMSALFRINQSRLMVCPYCQTECDGVPDEETECTKCGMRFVRVIELTDDGDDDDDNMTDVDSTSPTPSEENIRWGLSASNRIAQLEIESTDARKLKRKRDDQANDMLSRFKRVRVVSSKIFGERCDFWYWDSATHDWSIGGTGFARVKRPGLVGESGLPHILVESEDGPETLLDFECDPMFTYEKQDDTHIAWGNWASPTANSSDRIQYALSFEETDGCSRLWRLLMFRPDRSLDPFMPTRRICRLRR